MALLLAPAITGFHASACSRGVAPILLGRATRMGWFDDLTDGLLGPPAQGLGDGMAAEFARADEVTTALEEESAANGFDGRVLRDIIVEKWGKEYDVDFTVTDYLGKSSVYLNVFPWSSDEEPWRHDDQMAYLEHLQAVTDQLIKWKRVAAVRRQISETDKAPRRGTIPLKTVPIRLDLPNDLARAIDQSRGGGRGISMTTRIRTREPTMSTEDDGDLDDHDGLTGALALAGLVSQPIVWASLYSVATTGGGLPAGPFGTLGLVEGLSYLAIVGFVAAALVSKVRTGSGLPAGPGGLLGLAEGLSFLSVTAGLLVLAYTATGQGCVPNALPIADYSDVVNVCR